MRAKAASQRVLFPNDYHYPFFDAKCVKVKQKKTILFLVDFKR